jgi:hypothetical protein
MIDEACAVPFIARRMIPNAPSKRITRNSQARKQNNPHPRAGRLKPACAET